MSRVPDPIALPASTLTRRQAMALTAKVVKAGEEWFNLLVQTWELKAWAALRYPSWEAYAESELGMSVRNAYRVLDQGKVIRALQEAGVEANGAVSARQAQVLKREPEAVPKVAAKVAEGEVPKVAVAQVVREVSPAPAGADAPVLSSVGGGAPSGEDSGGAVSEPSPGRRRKVIEATAEDRPKAKRPPGSRPSRAASPAESAAYTVLAVDPTDLAAKLPREDALRLARELEAWLVQFSGALRPTKASPDADRCRSGHHPVGSRIGTACGACGNPKAWGK